MSIQCAKFCVSTRLLQILTPIQKNSSFARRALIGAPKKSQFKSQEQLPCRKCDFSSTLKIASIKYLALCRRFTPITLAIELLGSFAFVFGLRSQCPPVVLSLFLFLFRRRSGSRPDLPCRIGPRAEFRTWTVGGRCHTGAAPNGAAKSELF